MPWWQVAGFGWGATFAPVWVGFFLLALPLAWNERSTINWRAVWLVFLVPALLSAVLLVVSLDHHYYIPLSQCLIPVWGAQAFGAFVLVRVALRFGCRVVWRGLRCVLVSDPYSSGTQHSTARRSAAQRMHSTAVLFSSCNACDALCVVRCARPQIWVPTAICWT